MSFFNKLFGNSDEEKPTKSEKSFWKIIRSEEDLEAAVRESLDKTVAIFKHSTSCYISKMVLKNFENEVAESDKEVSYYFLDLLANRSLSNQIAEDFKVTHQSPQLIVLEKGSAVNNASHQSISVSII